mmetsp:Transcript_32668/g.52968  ORF Transcript_32668/g.52968 Transcript_32668/m.52968 type:complete len:218 (+) Transcript_32668:688-1341(+)
MTMEESESSCVSNSMLPSMSEAISMDWKSWSPPLWMNEIPPSEVMVTCSPEMTASRELVLTSPAERMSTSEAATSIPWLAQLVHSEKREAILMVPRPSPRPEALKEAESEPVKETNDVAWKRTFPVGLELSKERDVPVVFWALMVKPLSPAKVLTLWKALKLTSPAEVRVVAPVVVNELKTSFSKSEALLERMLTPLTESKLASLAKKPTIPMLLDE